MAKRSLRAAVPFAAILAIAVIALGLSLLPKTFTAVETTNIYDYDEVFSAEDENVITFLLESGGIAGLTPRYPHIFAALFEADGKSPGRSDSIIREAFAADGFILLPEDEIIDYSVKASPPYTNDEMSVAAIAFRPVNIENGGWLSPDRKRLYYYKNNGGVTYTVPDGVETIGYAAFYGNSVFEVILPDSVTSVERQSFARTRNLSAITLPDGLKEIGTGAFSESGIQEITIPDSVTELRHAFRNCRSLERIVLRKNLSVIGDYTFYNCSLTSVTLPDSITEIGAKAFGSCRSLTEIYIPESVRNISDDAFDDCPALVVFDSLSDFAA
ncbi:hypothetical protein FACS189499_06480 [Clostridia bacterium]|nr:hypothetical protein FACS189499_06480 [Clostridia bacterium]